MCARVCVRACVSVQLLATTMCVWANCLKLRVCSDVCRDTYMYTCDASIRTHIRNSRDGDGKRQALTIDAQPGCLVSALKASGHRRCMYMCVCMYICVYVCMYM
jgi:hypothetical protein